MWWTVALAANSVISVCYFAIAVTITTRTLLVDQQWRHNRPALATALIFFSCATGHGEHAAHLLFGAGGAATDSITAARAVLGSWHSALIDGFTAGIAVWYWTLRRTVSGALSGNMFLDNDDAERRRIAGAIESLTEGVLLASAVPDDTGEPVDLRVEHVNPALMAFRPEESADVVGRRYSEAFPGPKSEELLSLYLSAVRTRRPVSLVLADYSSAVYSGALEVTATPWEDGVAVTVRDVRERERVARELTATASALSRSNEDLEQFAFAASHDLGEPLRSIAGFTQLLAEETKDSGNVHAVEYAAYITDGVTRMRNLIDGLLEYSRITGVPVDGHSRPAIDSGALVADVIVDLRVAIAEADASVTVTTPLPVVLADPVEMRRVIQNLVANAIKFSRPGRPPGVSISATASGPTTAEFAVADDGIGIPREHRDIVFGMFQRLHRREDYAGTGIGLAVTRKIVERDGGRLWVDDTPGGGSTFRFTVTTPAARPSTVVPGPSAPADSSKDSLSGARA